MILIPEIKYEEERIAEYLLNRLMENKPYSIIVVAEGIRIPVKEESAARYMSRRISELTGLEPGKRFLVISREEAAPLPWTVFLQRDTDQQQLI